MEIRHLKYALEIDRCRSISKAAEKLFVSQPFLSKAIRELESELGTEVFNRTSRGVVATKKGEEFLARAREIVESMEELQKGFGPKAGENLRFEISVPIACYISCAFVEFMKALEGHGELHVNYRETNTMSTINHVAERDCDMGIIRYQNIFEDYYLRYLESRDLIAKPIWSYSYHLVMSKNSPLAERETLSAADLEGLIEISHGDPTVPGPLAGQAPLQRRPGGSGKRQIVVYERQSQFELLCDMPDTYMWASPTPQSVFDTYPLAERDCLTPENHYTDVLIYRRGYRLTSTDRLFIDKLNEMVESLRS